MGHEWGGSTWWYVLRPIKKLALFYSLTSWRTLSFMETNIHMNRHEKYGYTRFCLLKPEKSYQTPALKDMMCIQPSNISRYPPLCVLLFSNKNLLSYYVPRRVVIWGHSSTTLSTKTLALLLFLPSLNILKRFLTLPTLLPTLVAVSGR